MPYIEQKDRPAIRAYVEKLLETPPDTPWDDGELGYRVAHLAANTHPAFLFAYGDRTYAICVFLLLVTRLHDTPGFTSGVHRANKILRIAERGVRRDDADALAVLDCVRLELYMRYSFGYEKKKMEENGDILD